jgi:ABC-type antimicrobial peptide transport system permease subunit
VVAALLGVVVGVAGLLITTIDGVLTRTRQLGGFFALGIPRRRIQLTVILELLLPLALAVVLAVVAAAAMGKLFVRYNGLGRLPLASFGLILLGCAALAVALGVAAGLTAAGEYRLRALRTE